MTVLAVTALSLAGCARYHPQPLAPAAGAAGLTTRSLENPELRAFLRRHLQREPGAAPAQWDEQALTLTAFFYHPNLAVARAQWEVGQAELITAGGRPNPTVGVSPGYNFSAASGVTPWLPGVNFDVPVETMGKRGHRIARASEAAEASRLNLAAAAWQVQRNVRAGLNEVAAAGAREAVLRRQAAAQEALVNRLEERRRTGAVSAAEILPMRTALARTRADLASASGQVIEASSRLAEALGLPAFTAQIRQQGGWPVAGHPAGKFGGAELREYALRQRTDILAALAEYAALEAALQLEVARQYPDLHFNPGYQYDQGEHKWSVGITAELPLLNQNQGPIAEARARRAEAAARFTALQSKVIAEIDRTLAVYELAGEQAGAAGELLKAQQEQYQAVLVQQRAGAADAVDQLSAELELGAARLAQAEAAARLNLARTALEDAVQCPLESIGRTTPVELLRWVLLAPAQGPDQVAAVKADKPAKKAKVR